MFTGIIEAVGTIETVTPRGEDVHMRVRTGALALNDVNVGDSIAVSGVCLTVTALANDSFEADLSTETLRRTTFKSRRSGDKVNLEKALALGQRLGGHLVSGHVDGIGRVRGRDTEGRATLLTVEAPDALCRYIAEKGSICVDGVSLTVNRVDGARFTVSLVPHTLAMTTLDDLQVGDEVNLEVDMIARYLERLLQGGGDASADADA